MAGCLNFSLTQFKSRQLDKLFAAAGLESRQIDVPNGSSIHCWVTRNCAQAAAAAGEDAKKARRKPVVVLLHGFGVAATWQWSTQLKAMTPHFELVIPDLIFFGGSTTASADRSESFQAESVWQALCILGIETFSLAGTSYGGWVAYRIVQAHPDAVEKLVLSNSSICFNPDDSRKLCERGQAASTEELLLPTTRDGLDRVGSLVIAKVNQSKYGWLIPNFVINDMLEVLYKVNRQEKVELLQQLVFGKEESAGMLTKIEKDVLIICAQDVLIIWGDDDKIFLVEEAERAKEFLGKRAELVVLKNAGHVAQMERPAEWNSVVTDFLLGNNGVVNGA